MDLRLRGCTKVGVFAGGGVMTEEAAAAAAPHMAGLTDAPGGPETQGMHQGGCLLTQGMRLVP